MYVVISPSFVADVAAARAAVYFLRAMHLIIGKGASVIERDEVQRVTALDPKRVLVLNHKLLPDTLALIERWSTSEFVLVCASQAKAEHIRATQSLPKQLKLVSGGFASEVLKWIKPHADEKVFAKTRERCDSLVRALDERSLFLDELSSENTNVVFAALSLPFHKPHAVADRLWQGKPCEALLKQGAEVMKHDRPFNETAARHASMLAWKGGFAVCAVNSFCPNGLHHVLRAHYPTAKASITTALKDGGRTCHISVRTYDGSDSEELLARLGATGGGVERAAAGIKAFELDIPRTSCKLLWRELPQREKVDRTVQNWRSPIKSSA